MARLFAGLVAGIVLATVGTVDASVSAPRGKAYTLLPGQAVTYAGLTCTAYKGTTAANANIVCLRTNLVGYGVVVSQSAVVVAKKTNGKIHVVFKTKNQ
ncbi:MAG TPA: hypothetical protein VHC67_16405 [Gaiellaceae bacterium]|jgi:hypothetical protein|nr:hypothetical protein [Gaiellaceae bacterium]